LTSQTGELVGATVLLSPEEVRELKETGSVTIEV
jgi:hypothetical protein